MFSRSRKESDGTDYSQSGRPPETPKLEVLKAKSLEQFVDLIREYGLSLITSTVMAKSKLKYVAGEFRLVQVKYSNAFESSNDHFAIRYKEEYGDQAVINGIWGCSSQIERDKMTARCRLTAQNRLRRLESLLHNVKTYQVDYEGRRINHGAFVSKVRGLERRCNEHLMPFYI